MNIKSITYLISLLSLIFIFWSCNKDDSTITYVDSSSDDAQIYSFSVKGKPYKDKDSTARAMDSIRFIQVNKTNYAINQIGGVIYNPDSLPFGTVLRNKVAVTAIFNTSAGISKVVITTPDSVNGYVWNRTDSVDFSKMPITFTVTAPAGARKIYNIDIRTYKVDPDTIFWKQMQSYPSPIGLSKTILVKTNSQSVVTTSRFYTYSILNGVVSLFTMDTSGLTWQTEVVSGLPATVKPESIFSMNGVFYAILDNGDSYKSNDGKNWAQINNGKVLVSVLGVLPAVNQVDDRLLVTFEEGDKYYFGKTSDMSTIETVENLSITPNTNQVPYNFPIRDQASYTSYNASDGNKRMLILNGGIGSSNYSVNYTWFIKNTNNGLDLTPSSMINLFGGVGLSNMIYDQKLYVLDKNQFYISNKWVDTWYKAPNKQKLDPNIQIRTRQTLIVDDQNYIWIFGGVDTNGSSLNDVWRGRLSGLNLN